MINILDYDHWEEDERPKRMFLIKDDETNEVPTRLLQIYFFELQKFKIDVTSHENMWMSFLKNPAAIEVVNLGVPGEAGV